MMVNVDAVRPCLWCQDHFPGGGCNCIRATNAVAEKSARQNGPAIIDDVNPVDADSPLLHGPCRS
jgi:hypothetical protein